MALKRIKAKHAHNPACQRDFLREAEITGKLEHPGVVPIYGLVQGPDGNPSYAMRFIEGESLKDAIHTFHEADKAKRDPGERAVALRQLLNRFIAVRRKFWLIPIIVVTVMLGGLLVLAKGSVVAPFIYTLF